MSKFLGIDTSNYTTSVCIYDTENNSVISKRKLLPVKQGELGVRQSDAVFHHTVQLADLFDEFDFADDLDAVSVSNRPCDKEGSYFPCFLVGENTGRIIAKTHNIPLYQNSHQQGHIMAALYSSNHLNLINQNFIAFHVSGGTTEAVLCSPDDEKIIKTENIANSLDLNAGQVIDRIGVKMGLPFPAGKYIDELAQKSLRKFKIKPFMRNGCPSLSGLQNKCEDMLKNGESKEDIALYCLKFIQTALENMMLDILKKQGDLPVVFSGGVMSNSIIRKYFTDKYNAVFAEPQFSTDNAVGTAILGAYKYDKTKHNGITT
ncbi:MAG TPA: peptidase M22 [Clostridiales bacterium]|nr:peptidase M22 [Clostridiales bacterium]